MKCKNCNNLHYLTDLKDEVIGKWCPNINDCPDIEIERECEYCDTMTNADRIRNMSDEELAELLYKTVIRCGENLFNCCEPLAGECMECVDCYISWLQKEVE
jgi:hypothetical protein